jgi:hypothetical protein
VMEIDILLPENYLQHLVIYIQKENFSISFISNDYISFQAPHQNFITCLGRPGKLTSHSIDSDVYRDFIYLRYQLHCCH